MVAVLWAFILYLAMVNMFSNDISVLLGNDARDFIKEIEGPNPLQGLADGSCFAWLDLRRILTCGYYRSLISFT